MANLLYWVWLSDALTPGTDAFARLRSSFSSPKEIFDADEEALRAALGPRRGATVERLANKNLFRARNILDFVTVNGIGVLTYDDPSFPALLRTIPTPPVLLYYKGKLPDLNSCFPVGIVGSREHNEYAMRQTFEISYDLARGGATVISGMAKGIDGIAQAAALSAGGKVVAIIGSGIDVLYPKEHTELAKYILSNGAVMTEFSPGTPPYRTNFPKRNRLISGMSRAVLVTAGQENSGALITARYAKEQERDLFALPGNVDDPYSAAPSMLLREGARAATCAEDILFAYESRYPGVINLFRLLESSTVRMDKVLKTAHVALGLAKRSNQVKRAPVATLRSDDRLPQYEDALTSEPMVAEPDGIDEELERALSELPEEMRALYLRIPASGSCRTDELVTKDTPPSKVMGAITMLEIKGLVRLLPGGRIQRNRS